MINPPPARPLAAKPYRMDSAAMAHVTPSDEDLARFFHPMHLIAELTSRCNLRCKYCQKSMDSWNKTPGRDDDIDEDVLDHLFESLRVRPFQTVQLSGIGEFTFRKDWVQTLDRFDDVGSAVTLICNFAKQFTDDELDALLKTKNLMVSVDTMDAELLKSVRRSVSLSTISTNLTRLRMRAMKTGKPMPYLRLNAVLYYENLLGIEDLAYFAIEHRVNMMQYERMFPVNDIRPPNEIIMAEPERAREALRQIDIVDPLLRENGIEPHFHGDLRQLLEQRAAA